MAEKEKKKSLWEQMGRNVPAMVTEDAIIPTKKQAEEKKKKKEKSIAEQINFGGKFK